MKHILKTWFLCLLTLSGQSQDDLRHLLAALANDHQPDSVRIDTYEQLVTHFRFSNEDSARHFAAAGLAFARSTSDRKGEARLLQALADINEHHGHLDIAQEQYMEAHDILKALGDSVGMAQAINGLGVVAGRTGKYRDATRHFVEALRLFQNADHSAGIMQTYIKLGIVNSELGDLDKGLEYYLKAEQLNEKLGDARARAALLNNIGVVYGKRNELQTALEYFHSGLRLTESIGPSETHIILLSCIGLAYDLLGIQDSAWFYQQQALSKAREWNMPELEARALLNLSSTTKNTNPLQSLELLDRALAISEAISNLKLTTEVYEAMIQVYKKQGDFQKALSLTEEQQLLKDSIFSVQKAKEIAGLIATQKLARQESEMKELTMRTDKSILQRNIMIGVSLLAFAMMAIVWHYNRRISRLNTELIQNQRELSESNAVKDKLFSILGHDLRSPLNRVIGLLNLLSIRHLSADEKEIIHKLRHQSSMTLETLDNLLAWGKRQLKGIRLHQQIIKVDEQLQKSILLNEDYARQKGVTIVDDVPDDLYIEVDPVHFDFVMRNLLSNAIKFSHSGGSVSVTASSASGEYAVFAIRDSGVGIAADARDHIFNAGAKSAPGTWNEKGTGLGLMLSREYITQNGGLLWVESEEGKGSTFYFTLRQHAREPVAVN